MTFKLKNLIESLDSRSRVITFARANPPSIGHAKLVQHVIDHPVADKEVILSHSHDDKNPLQQHEKINIFHKMFPEHKHLFRGSTKEEPTIFHAATRAYRQGVKHLHVIVGSDRVNEFKTSLNKYNGKFDSAGRGYNFHSIHVESAGDRDPDAEGVEGISASKLRDAAKNNDFKTMRSGMHPNIPDEQVKLIMNRIKDRT